MDETQTRWFRWIANHAQYFFWAAWGAGLGAYGAVALDAVDLGEDALRIYLAVLTATMAGVFAIVSSRAMDSLTDRRKIRRKANLARLRIRRVAIILDGLREHLAKVAAQQADNADPQAELDLTEEDVTTTGQLLKVLADSLEARPDFDELVETEEDLNQVIVVEGSYIAAFVRLINADAKTNDEIRRHLKHILPEAKARGLVSAPAALWRAEKYFAARAAG